MRILVSVVALLSPVAAASQTAIQGDEPVIVVTGGGLETVPGDDAYSVRELERAQIVTAPSGRIEDVLASVAGFQQFRRSDSRSANPSAQGATLRALGGNATSRALITLDGVPVADPFFGYVPFAALAPERFARVRVVRGGGAGPFGSGALTGTIAIESAGADLPPVLASALANDRGGTETALVATGRAGGGLITASARYDRDPGFFTTPSDQRVPATARARNEGWSAGLRAVLPVADGAELQASALLFGDERTLRFDGADSGISGQDASLRLIASGAWGIEALAYVQARNFDNIVISSTRFVPVLDQRNTPSTGVGAKLEIRPPTPDTVSLRFGSDWRRASGSLSETAISAFSGAVRERRAASGFTSDVGVFAEGDLSRGAITLTGGVRADRQVIGTGRFEVRDAGGAFLSATQVPERSDWEVTWRAGARAEASPSLALRAAAYRGFRLPTLNELLRPFVVFPIVTEANAALEAERLEGYEIGFDWEPAPGVALTLTGFDNRVEDAIANVTLTPTLRQRQNLPAIEARGVEAGLAFESGAFVVDATASYTDARIVGSGDSFALDGNRPPQVPEFSAAATLAYVPADGWRLAATVRHVGAQFEADDETDRLPPATTLGLFASAPLAGRLSVVVRAENLLDERIVTRNAGGTLDLGTPRTVWAGLRYGF